MTPLTVGTPAGEPGFRPLAGWEEFVPVLVGLVLIAVVVITTAALGAWLEGRAVRRRVPAAVDDHLP